MFRFTAALALALSCFAGPVLADIAPDPLTTGGTSLAAKDAQNPDVAMLWEEVDLRPSATRNEVKAVFALRNSSDKEVTLEVGFPSYFEMPLKDFTVTVDGQPQAAQEKKTDPQGPKKVFTCWMCWPMTFAPGQERRVEVTYWVAVEPVDTLMTYAKQSDRSGMAFGPVINSATLPESLRDRVGGRASGYVLRTGAGWKDAIGKATIRLHTSDTFKEALISYLSPGGNWAYDAAAGVKTLVLENLEPTNEHDIVYHWRLSDVGTERSVMTQAMRDGTLAPAALGSFLRVLGWSATHHHLRNNPNPAQVDVMTHLVPPVGPAFTPEQAADYSTGNFYHHVYRNVMKHYQAAGNTDAVTALAPSYAQLLEALIAQRQAEKKTSQNPGDGAILDKQIAELQTELDALKTP